MNKIHGQFNRELASLAGERVSKELNIRRADFDKGAQAQRHDKQTDRWANGGYHRPGSNKHR